MLNKCAFRRMGRGFMAVFAVQLLAASFCAMPASAHIAVAPHQFASSTSYQEGDCSEGMPMPVQHQACAHCDMPDMASGSHLAVVAAEMTVLFHAMPSIIPGSQAPEHIGVLRTRILAPPRSTTLLFTTTQRILI
ncbi:MAG: hypothetical protein Q9M29_03585 [Mariprofundaceae bacterium]|nr:hypothetical protein [Mariprofundaceae bacterium]